MGYYLNSKEMPPLGKGAYLVENLDAYGPIVPPRTLSVLPSDMALVCVINNFVFDAAALIYNDEELVDIYSYITDRRQKYWYLVPKKTAYELSGYVPS